jgi:signal transduction histidine kinase
MNDITAEKKRQMDSFQSEKLGALSTLAAGIAHEIGNPLNSIGIHMQLMEKDIKNVKDTKAKQRLAQYVKSAKAEVGRLDKMIRTFLTAVRPSSLNLAEHNVNHILENVLDFLYYEISEKNIAIEKNYSQKLPLIPLDEEQIRQAFFNIIKNAVEAMPNGGQLSVSTGADKDEMHVIFADTGIGITDENLPKIFDPYFTTKQKGSGLGLMIVRKIINDHSGRIEVESRTGKGTKVRIFLPVGRRVTKMIQDKTAKQKG